MNQDLKLVCDALDALGDHVLAIWSDNRTLSEAFGWNCPALTRQDFSFMAHDLSSRLSKAGVVDVMDEHVEYVRAIPSQLRILQQNTVQYMFNGNAPHATAAYSATLACFEKQLEPYYSWQHIDSATSLPARMVKSVRACQARLDQVIPEVENLQEKIIKIKDAHDAAESLPADMKMLEDARKKLEQAWKDSSSYHDDIQANSIVSNYELSKISDRASAAEKLVAQCDEAYRITTTQGLAAAFDKRAKDLNTSMWVWVFGLFLSLVVGAVLGAKRVELLSLAVDGKDPHWGAIWIHIVLSVVCIAGPLWFAWLATKQIGQRFRLSEDYAFKASVAKAYEGYRKEAARFDEDFSARLFGSALNRLEEAPLRLVEGITHGSPWHELLSSPAFGKALETVPEFKAAFFNFFKNGVGSNKIKTANNSADSLDS